MKQLKLEFKKWLVGVLVTWAFDLCPNGKFRNQFALFIHENIMDL